MAVIDTLSLVFSSTQSCDGKTIYITDTTGVSSVGGDKKWGDTINLVDIVKVVITITDPDDNSYALTLYDTTVIPNITTWTPNTDGTPMSITYDLIGGTADTTIPDGVYIVEYTMHTATDQILPVVKYIFLHSQITCCVYEMWSDIDYKDCLCDYSSIDSMITAWTYYKALLLSIKCGNFNKADRLLTIVQRLCNYSGTCNSCN